MDRTFAICRNVSRTLATVKGGGLWIMVWDERLARATSPRSPNSYETKRFLFTGPIKRHETI